MTVSSIMNIFQKARRSLIVCLFFLVVTKTMATDPPDKHLLKIRVKIESEHFFISVKNETKRSLRFVDTISRYGEKYGIPGYTFLQFLSSDTKKLIRKRQGSSLGYSPLQVISEVTVLPDNKNWITLIPNQKIEWRFEVEKMLVGIDEVTKDHSPTKNGEIKFRILTKIYIDAMYEHDIEGVSQWLEFQGIHSEKSKQNRKVRESKSPSHLSGKD